jgi:hypothetical protein
VHSIRLFGQFGRWVASKPFRLLLISFVGTGPEFRDSVVVLHHSDEERMHFLPPVRLHRCGDIDPRLASLLGLAHIAEMKS